MTSPSQPPDPVDQRRPLGSPMPRVQPAGVVDADEGPARIDSVRQSFYDEVQERCFIFARDLLTLIPELESVAVVPAYRKTTEETPAAVLVGREGPPKTAIEVMHLAAQMHRVQIHLLKHAAEFLKYVDQELAESIRQLHEKRNELEELDAELAKPTKTAAPERPAPSGAASEDPGPGEDSGMGSALDR